jgi:hypothetical protein
MSGDRFKMSHWVLSPLIACLILASDGVALGAQGEPAFFERSAIFPPNPKHNHASCVVQLKDGSLLAAWYAGSGERTADDVVIEGSRLAKGKTTWGPKFLMADTPGYPDCNPALFAAADHPRPPLGRGTPQIRPFGPRRGRSSSIELVGVRGLAPHTQELCPGG